MKSVRISAWTGWMPGVFTPEEWTQYFQDPQNMGGTQDPPVPEIPAMLRRRMSRLNRMTAAVAFACCRESSVSPDRVPLVFASRHGEMGALMDLLSQMAEGASVSPTAFSHSVHHTSGSYFSIATGNKRPLRSVAGGDATFGYGFLDTIGLLEEQQNQQALLLVADERVPPIFEGLVEETRVPYAVAFLLSRVQEGPGIPLHFDIAPAEGEDPEKKSIHGIQALDFLQWLSGSEKSFVSVRGGQRWIWSK